MRDRETTSKGCNCECHRGQRKVHASGRCECGCVYSGDRQCPPPKKPRDCEPPEICPQPGTVDVPQPDPPPTFKSAPVPPEKLDKPPPGDEREVPWFKGHVRGILRSGPTFGPRKDEFLPYLLVRSSTSDVGNRPLGGVFWESPDIFVVPNQDSTAASLKPSTIGGVAVANAPNTLYAHVWNLGKAPAWRVRVEFYWFNPSLGISRVDANLIGATWIDLGNRFAQEPNWKEVRSSYGSEYLSRGCHAIVKCPVTWVPSYVNGGHECLVVRVTEPMMDSLPQTQFSAAADRRIAQRNIAVIPSASPASIDILLSLGHYPTEANAEVDVVFEDPSSMEWLKLYTGKSDLQLHLPRESSVAGFLPVTIPGDRHQLIGELSFCERAKLLLPRERITRGCEPLAIPFHASINDLAPGEAQVFRVRQRINGDVIGGYSVALLGT